MRKQPSDLYRNLERLLQEGKSAALAVVLSREGSGPREPGAMMVINAGGSTAGTVGGGILEARVIEIAGEVLRSGRPVCETFTLDADTAADDGMICGGVMEILVLRLHPSDYGTIAVFNKITGSLKEHRPAWLIISLERISDEIRTGTGFISADDIDPGTLPIPAERMKRMVSDTGGRNPVLAEENGIRFFIQPVGLETVFIFGGGHISEVLVPFCRKLDFYPVVLDDRPEYADPRRFPEAQEVLLVKSFEGCFDRLEIDGRSLIVAVTRGHAHDRAVVSQALRTPARYIGMIGSERKRQAVFDALKKQGFEEADLRRVRSPIGISIGARTPAEIAVSIVAELIAVRTGHHAS